MSSPGPWRYDYQPLTGFGCGYGKSQIIDAGNVPIAGVAAVAPADAPMYDHGTLSKAALDLVEANARLIAAAPTMLIALKSAADHLTADAKCFEIVRQAIGMAEGDAS